MSGMVGRALPPLPGQRASVQPQTNVDFFLPTGIMVSILISPMSTVREVKDQLFKDAKKFPLFSLLKDQGFYNFVGKSPYSLTCCPGFILLVGSDFVRVCRKAKPGME